MPRVPAPALVETYSVLTRLPPPHRAPVSVVESFLADRLAEPPLVLPIGGYRKLIEQAAAHGFAGGSIHDALIGAIAREAGAVLLTRDRRAAPVYERIGAPYQFVF